MLQTGLETSNSTFYIGTLPQLHKFVQIALSLSQRKNCRTVGTENCRYCRQTVLCTEEHVQLRHLKYAIYFENNSVFKFTIPCFCANGWREKNRCHWHCPKCQEVFPRTDAFKRHISHHGLNVTQQLNTNMPSQESAQSEKATKTSGDPDQPECPECFIKFHNPSNLRRHQAMRHGQKHPPVICVDYKNGIFVTPKDGSGPRIPIHVVKLIVGQRISCESSVCRDFMQIAADSGNPGTECKHLIRTNKSLPHSTPPPLMAGSLQLMVDMGLLSTVRQKECQQLQEKAQSKGVVSVFPIFWGGQDKDNYKDCYLQFSVLTGQTDGWCIFGRVRVSFDTRKGQWHCRCHEKSERCTHRCMCIWWVFQERPHLLKDTHHQSSDEEGEECQKDYIKETPKHQEYCSQMTEYLWQNKKVPAELPHELATKEKEIPALSQQRKHALIALVHVLQLKSCKH
ncbi:uncharacterized protein LOC143114989 [Alosa pseudoharengus]|uniref:uncharacterized protein LOC143114989 n=1 Tax=Alosa pseudoharengus TaxID=34774 RepID=UPI003F8A81A6